MKKFTQMALAGLTAVALALTGCGSSGSGSSAATAEKAATITGSLESGVIKAVVKSAANAIGTVKAYDAATGTVISSSDGTVNADGTFTVKVTPPATQAGIVLKATLNSLDNLGKAYRLIITDQLTANTTFTGKVVGPNSDAVVTQVSGTLAHGGILGDGGVLHTGTTLAQLASSVDTAKSTILPRLNYGYVVNTGGSGTKVPGISIIDRANQTVAKTITFDFLPGVRVNHFGNVTADGSELWLCSNKSDNSAGDVNVFDLDALRNVTSVTAANKSQLIKKSWTGIGCGVQNAQTPDGKYIFISSDQSPKGINVFDVKKKVWLGNIVNGNTAPHVGAFSPDGKTYYTSTAGSYHVVGYDISNLGSAAATETYKTLDLTKVLDVDFGYGNIHALRVHPNGKYLFAGNNTWPVPSGKTSTSGVSVIDLTTKKIIATLPGRPHNFAISPDAKFLLSTESTAADCDITPGDPGSLLQFIDISTLLTATPDTSKIKDILHYNHLGYGGSHAGWDLTTGILYYAVSADSDTQGWLIKLDTSGLANATPSVKVLGDFLKVGWAPHAVLFPGLNSD